MRMHSGSGKNGSVISVQFDADPNKFRSSEFKCGFLRRLSGLGGGIEYLSDLEGLLYFYLMTELLLFGQFLTEFI